MSPKWASRSSSGIVTSFPVTSGRAGSLLRIVRNWWVLPQGFDRDYCHLPQGKHLELVAPIHEWCAGETLGLPASEPKMGRKGLFLSCSNYPACKGSRDWP